MAGIVGVNAIAQNTTTWQGRQCAVVLTYDDALNVDLDNAIPALDSLGLKATFYLSGYSGTLDTRLKDWRAAAANGHELANHTLFHPCTGSLPGRGFVTSDYDLDNYSVRKITDEIRMTNAFLKAMDGKTERTFAYPCGDTKIHDTAYIEWVKNDFVAARGTQPEMPAIDTIDLYNIGCYAINGQTGAELIALVKQAMEKHTLLVFLFHGVGGGHSLNVSLPAHSELLHFLKQNEKNIWIAPMLQVAEYIKQFQTGLK
ncbi:chitooligosaccharide deacetylase [Ilyomonas limi]|uniref:Chitooligosaccharide deacetylase n=2 Tax=Ilyomonas limi TaxID=2575867 RepID=A0A4U3KYA1_9BACT|nr:chitooligosaccharide deacetylase [Ilyomonas limi]